MLNGDADGLADLFAPDAVIEFSFHGPPGTPVRLEGREVIREYSRQVMASPRSRTWCRGCTTRCAGRCGSAATTSAT
jgi:ketosteroid isomerase-like protein